MANWPETLPQQMGPDTSVKDEESRAIQSMDSGPASVRNRFTAIVQTIDTTIILTGAELVIFQTFFRTTLSHGQDRFTWTHPVDGSSVEMRFKTKPQWSCIRPHVNASERLWQAGLELEVLPS
jgi:hypothetical protein